MRRARAPSVAPAAPATEPESSMTSRRDIALLALFAALACPSCTGEGARPTPAEPPPELVLQGVTYRYYEGSRLAVSGTAREMTYRNATGGVTAEALFALLYDEAKGDIEAEASHVQGNLLLKWADAERGVELRDVNATHATTERASFDARKQRFFGETPVGVRGAGFEASAGTGFSLALRGDRVLHFQGPIESRIFPTDH